MRRSVSRRSTGQRMATGRCARSSGRRSTAQHTCEERRAQIGSACSCMNLEKRTKATLARISRHLMLAHRSMARVDLHPHSHNNPSPLPRSRWRGKAVISRIVLRPTDPPCLHMPLGHPSRCSSRVGRKADQRVERRRVSTAQRDPCAGNATARTRT